MKRIIVSLLFIMCISTIANAEFIQKNEVIPEFHQVLVSKTRHIDLSGEVKKEFVFFGDRESWAVQYDKTKSVAAKGGLIALSFFVGGMSAQAWNEMLNNNQYILMYDIENTKKEKTRIIAIFSANDFDDEEVIKSYLDEKIQKEIK